MLGANSRPTAVATYSWGGAARPAGLHTPACRRQMAACRAAGPATAPPAPAHERASAAGGTQEQHGVSSLSAPPRSSAGSSVTGGSSSTVGSHPVPSSWLSHSWHLPSLSLGQTDAMLIRLRRQLGWGGRWAWEHEEEEAAAADDWDEEEEEEEAGEAAGGALGDERPSSSGRSGGDEATAAQLVPSARGSHRRGGGQRQCRGRVLAGATAVRSSTRPWLRGDDPLAAEEMQVGGQCGLRGVRRREVIDRSRVWLAAYSGPMCLLGKALDQQACTHAPSLPPPSCLPQGWDGAHVLTAAQEAWLSMLVQRAQAAESSMPPAAAPSSRAAPAEQERAHVMRQGEAARQLLFDANLRLVPFARKKLLGGSQLEAGLYEVRAA